MLRYVKISQATSGGSATIQFIVPGTFAGFITGNSNFSGRIIKKMQIFFGSPASGDYCSGFTVSDPNGVIPANVQGLFPNYPTLFSFNDPQWGGSNGFFINANEPKTIHPTSNYGIIPSGLQISATFTKGSISLGDTIYLDIEWDDLISIP